MRLFIYNVITFIDFEGIMNLSQYVKRGNLNIKNLISLKDIGEEEIAEILSVSRELKNMRLVHEVNPTLKDKYVLLLTKNNYPRSEITFQIAVKELLGEPVTTTMSGELLDSRLADIKYIQALSACGLSAVVVCTSMEQDAVLLNKTVSVPVINATALFGPCETLASLLTIAEITPNLNSLKATVVGNLDECATQLVIGLVKMGIDVTLLPCEKGEFKEESLRYLSQFSEIVIEKDKKQALKNADYVFFTQGDGSFKVYKEDFELNAKNYKTLSSVPVDKTLADDELFAEDNCLIVKQAENLLHVTKALLSVIAK